MISILMPIYNGIEYINESVMSILCQKYKNWELIIGINGHPPGSDCLHIAKMYEPLNSNITVIDLHNCVGKSNALNEMIKYCKYDWISILDVDDIWLPTKLESQVPFTDAYDVIGTQCRYFGERTGSPNIPFGDITKFNFTITNPIINSSCLVKKHLCYWSNEPNVVEDYDLWLRLWKTRYRFYNIQDVQVLHRIHIKSAFNSRGNDKLAKKLVAKYV
jgi:glycosyltransferase involved in cell wall biosynthesis